MSQEEQEKRLQKLKEAERLRDLEETNQESIKKKRIEQEVRVAFL